MRQPPARHKWTREWQSERLAGGWTANLFNGRRLDTAASRADAVFDGQFPAASWQRQAVATVIVIVTVTVDRRPAPSSAHGGNGAGAARDWANGRQSAAESPTKVSDCFHLRPPYRGCFCQRQNDLSMAATAVAAAAAAATAAALFLRAPTAVFENLLTAARVVLRVSSRQ
jgi:hypothetical protein